MRRLFYYSCYIFFLLNLKVEIYVLILIGCLLLILGLIGCVLPVIPGPPIAFLSLLLLQFSSHAFSINVLILVFSLTVLVTFADYWLQIYGVKKFGGKKKAALGSFFGLLIGLFFFYLTPLLIIIGPFIGAYLGALFEKKSSIETLKIATGSLVGFLGGTIIKICTCIFIAILFFKKIY